VKERLRPLGGVSSIAVMILVAACGGNSRSGEHEDAGGTGGSANGSGAVPDDGGNNDSGAGGGFGGTPTGGRASTAGKSGAGAPSRGGAGGAPMPPPGGTLGEAGSPDQLPMAGDSSSSAGAGGEDAVTPPEGCTVLAQSSGTNTCELGLRCGGDDFMQTYCIDMQIGVWQCECLHLHGPDPLTYNLGGVTDLAACEAMAELCRSDTPPTLVGPVECAPALEMRSASSCQIRRACTQEIDGFTDATWAVLDETYCDKDTGRFTCVCSNSGWSYYLDGHDGTTACDVMSEFCKDPVEPDFEAVEWDCQPNLESSDNDSCETRSSCKLTATVADGITVPQNSWIDVACQNSANGSTCTCIGGPGEFRIDNDAPVAGTASCTDLSNFCVGLGDVEFSGDPSCSNVSLTTQEVSCAAELRCAASATVSGREVTTLRPVSVSCTATDGRWSCTCSSDQASTTFPVEGSDPWNVCTNASDACADVLVAP
jgi:hypothetical protein